MTHLVSWEPLTLDLAPEDPAGLLARLCMAGVVMNECAERLIADPRMRVEGLIRVTVVERTLTWMADVVDDTTDPEPLARLDMATAQRLTIKYARARRRMGVVEGSEVSPVPSSPPPP